MAEKDTGRMNEAELLTVLKSQIADSIKYSDNTFSAANVALDRAYRQEPDGYEEPDHSQVISSDVYDTVESDMPSFARAFLSSKPVMKFTPNTENDAEECREKTKLADFLIRRQPESFRTIYGLLKQPGKAKCSIAYYYMAENQQITWPFYEGLSKDELLVVQKELEGKDGISRVEIESETENDDESGEGTTYDIRFRCIKETKKITVAGVPPENFIISRGAMDKESAMLVGHEDLVTKGELIAEGYSKDKVMGLPVTGSTEGSTEKDLRYRDKGGWDQHTGYHWTNEEVLRQTLFPLVDFDGDGIPERRMIVKIGEKIFENEPYSIVPYAIFSQMLEPFAAIGNSRGEQAARYQLEKTAIKRGLMDNIYAHNRPRLGVDDSNGPSGEGMVDLDDALNRRIDGIIRTQGPPGQALFPVNTPFVGDKALMVIQYLDSEKSMSLGNMLANQGLQADSLYNETATRFEGVQESQGEKVGLVNRVYAETGFRELYQGVIWLAQHYQDTATEIMVLGKPMLVDPRKWQYTNYCESDVGLGAGDSDELIQNLGAIVQQQMALIQAQSPLADWQTLYNSLEDMLALMEKPDAGRYFNNPEIPEDTLMAQNMQLTQMVQVMQKELETTGSLAAAEMAKAQASFEGKKLDAAQKRDDSERDYEYKMRELALKEQELQVQAQANQVKILETIANIRNTQADTKEQEMENQAVESGLNDLLGMLVVEGERLATE